MRAVIQRVHSAVCRVDGEVTGQCGRGFCIMLGIREGDNELEARLLADKIVRMRVFKDENGKLNRSLLDVGGEMLVISNFTLCGDCHHGNRPDFGQAMKSERSKPLYEHFVSLVRDRIGQDKVGTGQFGGHMHIDADLNGPITIVMDSEKIYSKERKNDPAS